MIVKSHNNNYYYDCRFIFRKLLLLNGTVPLETVTSSLSPLVSYFHTYSVLSTREVVGMLVCCSTGRLLSLLLAL